MSRFNLVVGRRMCARYSALRVEVKRREVIIFYGSAGVVTSVALVEEMWKMSQRTNKHEM